jgi:hypothetical protein
MAKAGQEVHNPRQKDRRGCDFLRSDPRRRGEGARFLYGPRGTTLKAASNVVDAKERPLTPGSDTHPVVAGV